MCHRLWPCSVAPLLCLSITLFCGTSLGQGKKGKGDGDTSAPPLAPISYVLDIIPVEGLSYGGDTQVSGACLNDDGWRLCTLETAKVASAEILTDSQSTLAIVNVLTGEIKYVDNLLTSDTVWTQLPDGAAESEIMGYGINNDGDIIAFAGVLQGEEWGYTGYFLACLRDGDGVITGYQPTALGRAVPQWLNDFGEIIIDTGTEQYLRRSSGEKVFFANDFPNGGYVTVRGFNNLGQIYGTQRDSTNTIEEHYLWNLNGSVVSPPDIMAEAWGLNDFSAVAGSGISTFEEKVRGKLVTSQYIVPAVSDPVLGLIELADFRERAYPMRINNQRLNDESTVLARMKIDAVRTLWLKLPGFDGFYLHDALNTTDQLVWQGLNYDLGFSRDLVAMTTPRFADGGVDHAAAPIVVGIAEPENFVYEGLFVFRPAE